MRSPSMIVALILVGAGCAASADESPAAGAPGTLQPATQYPPQPRQRLANASLSAAGQVVNAQDCQGLQDRARNDFATAVSSLAVAQCVVDADCNSDAATRAGDASPPRQPFRAFTDACWETCSSTPGTEAYGDALKAIGARVCSEHRAAGCPVHPSGCPFQQPVAMRCVDRACRS